MSVTPIPTELNRQRRSRPPANADPVHVSKVLRDMLEDPGVSEDAKDAIRAGIDIRRAHPWCPCYDCHRTFGTV